MLHLLAMIQMIGTEAPLVAHVPLLPPPCARSSDGEIVVCKPAVDPNRMGPRLPDPPGLLPDAEFRLFGGVRAKMRGEQRGLGGGVSVPAAMMTFRIPF